MTTLNLDRNKTWIGGANDGTEYESPPFKTRRAIALADGATSTSNLTRPEYMEDDSTYTSDPRHITEIDTGEQWRKEENFRGLEEVEKPGGGNDGLGVGSHSG